MKEWTDYQPWFLVFARQPGETQHCRINRTRNKYFLFSDTHTHILLFAVFQGRISEFMTRALRNKQVCVDPLLLFKSGVNGACTYTLEYRMKGERRTHRRGVCARLERQAHYAVQDILYHQLTFIMLNLPQARRRPTCAANAKQPSSTVPDVFCGQRLMGAERCVTASPCIKRTCSWKVQDSWCLPGDTFNNTLEWFAAARRSRLLKCSTSLGVQE